MRNASKPGPSAVPFVQAAAGTVAKPAPGRRRSPTQPDAFSQLRELCARRDAGILSESDFAPRNAALLQGLNRRLSTKSPLLISGNDPYAEERAASW